MIAAGGYPLAEGERAAGRSLPSVLVPPGVDTERFRPARRGGAAPRRASTSGCPPTGPLVVSLSRLVPRKGMDVLIRAAAALADRHPGLTVAIGGGGRDRSRLDRLIRETGAPVRMVGRVSHDDLPRFYGCGDVYAMLCRNRWAGLEQEGFGIVFLEAAAAGVPAGRGRQRRRRRSGAARRDRAGRPTVPTTSTRWPPRSTSCSSDPDRRRPHGRGRTAASRRGVHLRPAGRPSGRRAGGVGGWPSWLTRSAGPPSARSARSLTKVPSQVAVSSTPPSSAPVRWSSRASRRRPTPPPSARCTRRCPSACSSSAPAPCSGPTPWACRAAAPSSSPCPGLFFLAGEVAPPATRRALRIATGVEVVAVVAAASIRPYTEVAFGILAPMFGLGMMGVWGGRHGEFPPRPPKSSR